MQNASSAPKAKTDSPSTNVKSGYQKGKLVSGGLNLVHGISNRAEVSPDSERFRSRSTQARGDLNFLLQVKSLSITY